MHVPITDERVRRRPIPMPRRRATGGELRSCYVCGAINTAGDQAANMLALDEAALQLRSEGWMVLYPMSVTDPSWCQYVERLRGQVFRDTPEYAWLLEKGLHCVVQVGTIFAIPGWEASNGARFEVMAAQQIGKPTLLYHRDKSERIELPRVYTLVETGYV